eukprot:jgi/Botrbrau1/1902/Bobra.0005s0017.1
MARRLYSTPRSPSSCTRHDLERYLITEVWPALALGTRSSFLLRRVSCMRARLNEWRAKHVFLKFRCQFHVRAYNYEATVARMYTVASLLFIPCTYCMLVVIVT